MEDYEASTYGDRIAEVYDSLHPGELLDTDSTVRFLAARAGSGPVLELAIGTGRVALPLVQRGLEVHGIDASEGMVSKLRAKPGGRDVPVVLGDFKDVPIEGRFSLIYLTFNTIYALTTQEDQATCLRNVAEHLTDEGVFVLDGFYPDTSRFQRNQVTNVNEVEVDRVFLDVSRHDPLAQTISSQHLVITSKGIEMYPVHLRYIWPSELDLMARLAGLELKQRFAGYSEQPFTSTSGAHVSVYGRPTARSSTAT
jgi:ubiquinone/menaquinone biosynthesis C-methylase UbiE